MNTCGQVTLMKKVKGSSHGWIINNILMISPVCQANIKNNSNQKVRWLSHGCRVSDQHPVHLFSLTESVGLFKAKLFTLKHLLCVKKLKNDPVIIN